MNFAGRKSALTIAMTFEDPGVSDCNGGGAAIQNAKYLAAAGFIVSVEARHAAEARLVRGVRPWTGAFDKPMSKAQALAAAKPFILSASSAAN